MNCNFLCFGCRACPYAGQILLSVQSIKTGCKLQFTYILKKDKAQSNIQYI